jgi:putative aldouronate transport system permease protein
MKNTNWSSRLFDVLNYTLLATFALLTLLPFLHVLVGSFASTESLLRSNFLLIPTEITLDAYRFVFSTGTLFRSLAVTVYITVVGTLINIIFTSLTAYPLARRTLMGRKSIMLMIIFSMLFSGGMIPTYLVVKAMGMLNTYWALFIPSAISAFNLIVLKNFFQQLPDGLEESAKMDGANDLGILIRIVLPLSMPAIATFSLFYAVGHWNTFFSAVLYLNDTEKWPVQVLLRQIVILSQGGIGDHTQFDDSVIIPPQSLKMAVIVISTVPILIVYPFLQKHFDKGVLLGSVKG